MEDLFFDLNANRKFPVTDIIRKSPRFEQKYANQNIQNEATNDPLSEAIAEELANRSRNQ